MFQSMPGPGRLLLAAFLLCTPGAAMAASAVDCDQSLLDAIRTDRTAPPRASRAIAISHVALFDAVDSLAGFPYRPYLWTEAGPAGASPEAAAAQACWRSLSTLFPGQQASFDAARATALAAIPEGAAKEQGIAHGDAVALALLAARADDGASAVVDYEPPVGAGWWTKTPPAYAAAVLPHWGGVRPWALEAGSEVRPPAPPSPRGGEYAAAYDEVRRLGASGSVERTADQTEIALFWADGGGTETPPGHWCDIAGQVAGDLDLPLLEEARLFALLGVAIADAAIAAWDAKYTFDHWRPYTGIHDAGSDGNPATGADSDWEPLLPTPPFPAYVSGHSTFSSAAARVLALFVGSDDYPFSTVSDALPGVERSFPGFWAAAEEAGQSRIYGGIHWQYDNQRGLAAGRAIADRAWARVFLPNEEAAGCEADAQTLCLNQGRFRVRAEWSLDGATFEPAGALSDSGDSGRFWFLNAANTEVDVKVLDACAGVGRYWVFVAGLTDFEVRLDVLDTASGERRRYGTDLGEGFEPVIDARGFATCP